MLRAACAAALLVFTLSPAAPIASAARSVNAPVPSSTRVPPAAPPRLPLLVIAVVLTVSVSLHVVPQALKAWIDPAWTMAALMVVDALVVALLARTMGALRTLLLLVLLFGAVVLTRQQSVVALPSLLLYLTLAGAFAFTLRRGQEPIIVRIARASYPHDLTPAFERYLRGLTATWALFFIASAALTVLLSLFAPFAWWSLFANILSWLAMLAMFVGEYLLRRWLRPELPAHTPLQTLASTMAYGIGRRTPPDAASSSQPRSA